MFSRLRNAFNPATEIIRGVEKPSLTLAHMVASEVLKSTTKGTGRGSAYCESFETDKVQVNFDTDYTGAKIKGLISVSKPSYVFDLVEIAIIKKAAEQRLTLWTQEEENRKKTALQQKAVDLIADWMGVSQE